MAIPDGPTSLWMVPITEETFTSVADKFKPQIIATSKKRFSDPDGHTPGSLTKHIFFHFG